MPQDKEFKPLLCRLRKKYTNVLQKGNGLLGAKPTDGPDAHERRDEVDHLALLRSQRFEAHIWPVELQKGQFF